MTYQKFSRNSGVVLVDILLALALSSLMTGLIVGSTDSARSEYVRAKEKAAALRRYENGDFSTAWLPFGNDRREAIDTAVNGSTSLQFIRVQSLSSHSGQPICTTGFKNNSVIGSYGYDRTRSNAATVTIVPVMLPVNPLLPLTDLQVRNGLAYVTADSNVTTDPDLLIFDIREPDHPKLLNSISSGPGLVSLALNGNRIFAAAPSTAGQLHKFRVDAPDSIVLEQRFKLPLPYATATPPLGSSLFYENGTVYLGTEKWADDEFNIIDVNDPLHPHKMSGVEIGGKVNDIVVQNNIAYIASADVGQFRAIDVTDSSSPRLVHIYSPTGSERQEGRTTAAYEGSVALGRTSGGYNIQSDHEAFAWSSSMAPLGNIPQSIDIPGGVYGILFDDAHIYLATREMDKELHVFDRALSTSSSETISLPVAPQDMTCDNDTMYILSRTSPVIYEISFK